MIKGLISIIVPNYNNENLIERCLNSILDQTYKNIEVIVVDDGSKDNSWEIIKRIEKKDSRVKAYKKNNSGVSDTRNYGLDKSNGEYIGFVDSDDYIDKNMYQCLYDLQNKYDTDISIIKEYSIEECENPIYIFDVKEALIELNRGVLFSGHMMTKLFKSKLFTDVRFSKDIAVCEDLLITHYLFQKTNKVVYCDKAFYHRTPNPNSVMRTKFKDSFLSCRIASKHILDFFIMYYPDEIQYAYYTLFVNNFLILKRISRTFLYEKKDKYKQIVREIVEETIFAFENCDIKLFTDEECKNIKILKKGFLYFKIFFYFTLVKNKLLKK